MQLKQLQGRTPKRLAERVSKIRRQQLTRTDKQADTKIIHVIYKAAERVTECTGLKFEVDHITPVIRGGKHHQNNLCILPAAINGKKGARLDFDLTPWLGLRS